MQDVIKITFIVYGDYYDFKHKYDGNDNDFILDYRRFKKIDGRCYIVVPYKEYKHRTIRYPINEDIYDSAVEKIHNMVNQIKRIS